MLLMQIVKITLKNLIYLPFKKTNQGILEIFDLSDMCWNMNSWIKIDQIYTINSLHLQNVAIKPYITYLFVSTSLNTLRLS
jgi:hypothetical protein